jgi:NADH-quinone oxidoreductase subunit M
MTHFPFALALLLWPALSAVVGATVRSERVAHAVAVAATAAVIVTAGAAGAVYSMTGPLVQFGSELIVVPGSLTLRLGLDGEAIVLVALLGVVAFATLVAMPRAELRRPDVLATLAVTGAGLLVAVSRDLASFTAGWVAALVPGTALVAGSRRPELAAEGLALRRAHRALLAGASIPVIAAASVLGVAACAGGRADPFALDPGVGSVLAPEWQRVVGVLLALGVFVRTAVVPVHGWLPSLLARGHASPVVVLASTPLGAVLLTRVVAPVLPAGASDVFPWISWVSAVAAVVASLLAGVQSDVRRVVAFVVAAQASMGLVGVATCDVQGVTGGLLQSLTTGLSASGLVILSWALVARTGTGDMGRLGGLLQESPRLGALWFLLGLAMVGLPGTLGFIGEDLITQGLLRAEPVQAALVVLATALNAIAFFRAYARVFLGPRSTPTAGGPSLDLPDLLPRKRAVAFGLLVLVLGGGLYPQPVIDLVATGYEAMTLGIGGHR